MSMYNIITSDSVKDRYKLYQRDPQTIYIASTDSTVNIKAASLVPNF